MTAVNAVSANNSADNRILLVGSDERALQFRANVLRSHGVEVDVATDAIGARSLWQPSVYALLLVDIRRHLPGEALDFCRHIRDFYPEQRIAFIVGPPQYISTNWPEDVLEGSNHPDQWDETIHRLVTAA